MLVQGKGGGKKGKEKEERREREWGQQKIAQEPKKPSHGGIHPTGTLHQVHRGYRAPWPALWPAVSPLSLSINSYLVPLIKIMLNGVMSFSGASTSRGALSSLTGNSRLISW